LYFGKINAALISMIRLSKT